MTYAVLLLTGPPKPGYQPTIYVSGDDAEAVAEVENTLSKQDALLKIRILKSQGIGAASALKLSYAGMTKGFTALASTMILGPFISFVPARTVADLSFGRLRYSTSQ